MALSKTTQDHNEIQNWAEKHGAKPAEVKSTHNKNEPGILRFCFPDAPNQNNENLREISWDEFFEKFDDNNLELIYQEKTAEGAASNFNKLIYPEDEHHSSRKSGSASHGGSHSSTKGSSHSGSHTASAKGSSHSGSHSGSGKSSSHASSSGSKTSEHAGSSKSSGRSSKSSSSKRSKAA